MRVSRSVFLVEPILGEVWPGLFEMFHIQKFYGNFQTIGMNMSLKFTNVRVKSINFTFLLQDFRLCFCEWMISLFFKN